MLTNQEILEPLRDFLLTYPYTTPVQSIAIDYGQVEKSDDAGEGNALTLVSRLRLRESKTVTGRVIETWRFNFALIIWRDTNDNELRREISEFIIQLISWVNDENRKRGRSYQNPALPTFSDTEVESLNADGGGLVRILPADNRSEFRVALHIDFQKLY